MRDYGQETRSLVTCVPRFCAAFCGISVRLLLLAVVAVNLGVASALIQRFTSSSAALLQSSTPPAAIIFSEAVSAISIAWLLISFCFVAVPMLLLVGDTVFFVGWFAATIILGASLNQTLQYSCQTLVLSLTGYSAIGYGYGLGSSYLGGQNSLAQQVFDSCNISKVLFAFHVIATVLFISVSLTAALQASLGGAHRRQPKAPLPQQPQNYTYNRGPKHVPGAGLPEIVV